MTRAGKRLSQIEALREEICRLRLQLESDTYQFEALAAWALEAGADPDDVVGDLHEAAERAVWSMSLEFGFERGAA